MVVYKHIFINIMSRQRVYLDHAATTPIDPRVKEAMEPFLTEEFGNAGGLYREGRRAKETVDQSRETVAEILGCRPEEIIFTSGGTEGDNLALFGIAHAYGKPAVEKPRGHIITSAIEHHAVLHACKALEKEGFEITYLPVDKEGFVNPNDVRKALRPDTILVSVMYANNEIGTIEPIVKIAKIIKEYRKENQKPEAGSRKLEANAKTPFLHSDACQAGGALDLNAEELGVDLMVLNGGKIYGPKGSGCLYVRRNTKITPLFYGGGQEFRKRAGTENVASIVGFATALALAQRARKEENTRVSALADYFYRELMARVSRAVLNGPAMKISGEPTRRLPNNINVSVLDIEGEAFVLYMDEKGVACSTGSACTSESLDPSHVILALGKPYEFAHASLRFTLGRKTTKEDLDYTLGEIPGIVEILRRISPLHITENAFAMTHPEVFAGQGLKVKAGSANYK